MSGLRAALCACLLVLAWPVFGATVPTVAAGADMTLALKEIAGSFSRQTNRKVALSFGASVVQAQQIADGAAVELFLSADEAGVISLKQLGKAEDEGKIYGVGRIVFFVPDKKVKSRRKDAPRMPAGGLAGLKAALEQGSIKRLTIPNPEVCPYGRVARQALQDVGVWATLGDRLVLTQDAAQSAELALNGKVDAAMLPLSLAVSPLARSRGSFTVVDSKLHRPLRQRMALITGAGETARLFYAYLQAPVAREVLRRYGYTFPVKQE